MSIDMPGFMKDPKKNQSEKKDKIEKKENPEQTFEQKLEVAREAYAKKMAEVMDAFDKQQGHPEQASEERKKIILEYLDRGELDRDLYEEITEFPNSELLVDAIKEAGASVLTLRDDSGGGDVSEKLDEFSFAGDDLEVDVLGEGYVGMGETFEDYKLALEKLRGNYLLMSYLGQLPKDQGERHIQMTHLLASELAEIFDEQGQEVPAQLKLLMGGEELVSEKYGHLFTEESNEKFIKLGNEHAARSREEAVQKMVESGVSKEMAERRMQVKDEAVFAAAMKDLREEGSAPKELLDVLLEKYPGLKGFVDRQLAE